MNTPAIIVDLDNTLCDTRHREHLVAQRPRNWVAYSMACVADPCIEWVADVVRSWSVAVQGSVFILSGRNSEARQETVVWLRQHRIPWLEVILRKPNEHEPNAAYKVKHAQRIQQDYDVQFILDDHPGVIQAMSEIGIPGLWVARSVNPHFPQLTNDADELNTVEKAYA